VAVAVVVTLLVTVETAVVDEVVLVAPVVMVTVQSPSQLNSYSGFWSPAVCLIVPVPQRFPLVFRQARCIYIAGGEFTNWLVWPSQSIHYSLHSG
jgi:hypothetical protein